MTRPARPELIALLRAVKERPSDPTPWLILTDWLEEHGDPADVARAEYCRLCFDRLGKKTYASDWEKGERRRDLYRQWHSVWLRCFEGSANSIKIQKGLLRLTISSVHLLALAGTIPRDDWEWAEELELVITQPEDFSRIAACPLLEGPTSIQLRFGVGPRIEPDVAATLAGSPFVDRWHRLMISGRPRLNTNQFDILQDLLGDRLILNLLTLDP